MLLGPTHHMSDVTIVSVTENIPKCLLGISALMLPVDTQKKNSRINSGPQITLGETLL
jgi:hypothetical protein